MKTLTRLSRGEIAIVGACFYLAALFMSCIAMWWVMLVGGNPFTVENLGVINKQGSLVEKFRAGDVVGIKRRICAESETAIEFFPALRDARGFLFPLPSGVVKLPAGCSETIYGFIVPNLPFGEYTYVSTLRFQKNLVGRDEQAVLPQLRLRIMRKRPSSAASEPAAETPETFE